ncbi:MAG: hypothetical protein ACR2G3_07405 [Solirubrobacterales bacterium]
MHDQGGSSLDRIARELASGEFSRRTALRRLAGATLAAALPGAVLADSALGRGLSCVIDADCDDGNPCTDDSCVGGACSNVNVQNGTSCGDANVCNGAETCQGGFCLQGTPLVCDDGNPCTTDSCDPGVGCMSSPVANGTACNQNGGTVCMGGQCVAEPPPDEPETIITRDPGATTTDRTPKFRFKSVPAGATFECSIDGASFKVCESPHTTKRLSLGRHKFKVRAILGGVPDPTPAIHKFKVVR